MHSLRPREKWRGKMARLADLLAPPLVAAVYWVVHHSIICNRDQSTRPHSPINPRYYRQEAETAVRPPQDCMQLPAAPMQW